MIPALLVIIFFFVVYLIGKHRRHIGKREDDYPIKYKKSTTYDN